MKSGQVPSLPISLHRSPFAGAKVTNLPFQIPPERQMDKNKSKIKNIYLSQKWVKITKQYPRKNCKRYKSNLDS
jgi:hypothetical protein